MSTIATSFTTFHAEQGIEVWTELFSYLQLQLQIQAIFIISALFIFIFVSDSKEFEHIHRFPRNNAMPEWQTNHFHESKTEFSLSLQLKEINLINLKLFQQ
jgi:hypothetical protein